MKKKLKITSVDVKAAEVKIINDLIKRDIHSVKIPLLSLAA